MTQGRTFSLYPKAVLEPPELPARRRDQQEQSAAVEQLRGFRAGLRVLDAGIGEGHVWGYPVWGILGVCDSSNMPATPKNTPTYPHIPPDVNSALWTL